MSTLDRLHKVETALLQLQSYSSMLQNQISELTANNAHLGKMLMATVDSLIKLKVLDDAMVLTKVSELEDEQTRDHVNQMLKLNAIVRSEKANEKSVFILKQIKNGEVISNYFLAPFANLPQEINEQLVGAEDGFKFTYGEVEAEVLEIYNQATAE